MSKKKLREKLGYVELLDFDGSHWIVANRTKRKRRRFIFLFCCFLFLLLFVPVTYSKYISNLKTDSDIKVAPWKYRLNDINTDLVTVALEDTIIDNDFNVSSVVPGAEGKIPLKLDFSGTKVAVSYQISLVASHVPENLKFYTDAEMTKEFQTIQGDILLKDIDSVVVENVYWKWQYSEDDETQTWTNQDISASFHVSVEQKVE